MSSRTTSGRPRSSPCATICADRRPTGGSARARARPRSRLGSAARPRRRRPAWPGRAPTAGCAPRPRLRRFLRCGTPASARALGRDAATGVAGFPEQVAAERQARRPAGREGILSSAALSIEPATGRGRSSASVSNGASTDGGRGMMWRDVRTAGWPPRSRRCALVLVASAVLAPAGVAKEHGAGCAPCSRRDRAAAQHHGAGQRPPRARQLAGRLPGHAHQRRQPAARSGRPRLRGLAPVPRAGRSAARPHAAPPPTPAWSWTSATPPPWPWRVAGRLPARHHRRQAARRARVGPVRRRLPRSAGHRAAPGSAHARRWRAGPPRCWRDLRQRPRCERVKELLDTRADLLPAAVDALLLDEAPASPSADNPIARCPELPAGARPAERRHQPGAPLFNKGDHDGCRRLYERTARDLLGQVIPARPLPGDSQGR